MIITSITTQGSSAHVIYINKNVVQRFIFWSGTTQEWAVGATPWPQAPKDGKIIYTGDGR